MIWLALSAGESDMTSLDELYAGIGFFENGQRRGIYAIYIDPAYIGKGGGKALLGACTDYAISNGFHAMISIVLSKNCLARSFYESSRIICPERSQQTSPQAIVNMFARWYEQIGFDGCSSHSGRRTFITNAARKISLVGGSLRDVQMLAGHTSLRVTQRYIDATKTPNERSLS